MNPIPVVAAVILDERNRVLIAQRKQTDSQGGLWEFPGGKLKASETPEQCLIREIKEELGLSITVGNIFSAVNHAYSDKSILLLAYHCRIVGGTIQLKEHQDAKWVKLGELLNFNLSAADIPVAKKLIKEAAQ